MTTTTDATSAAATRGSAEERAGRLAAARARLAPLFAEAAEGASRREAERELPRAQVRALAAAGFGNLRVPADLGGDGLTWVETAELLVEAATADPALPQIFRGHLAWVEHLLTLPPGSYRDGWLARVTAGDLVGNAWSATGDVIGRSGTVVERDGAGWVVSGRKYYTTGTIFADWADVTCRVGDEASTALVRTGQDGVTVSDDWDGFGQRVTGTGTLVLDRARVEEEDVAPFEGRFRYQTALYQLVLLTVQAGIAAAIERDTGAEVRARTRTYTHGLAPLVREDPAVLAVAGEISAAAFAARLLVRGAAEAVQGAADTAARRDSPEDLAANVVAEIATAQAQVVLSRSVPAAATALFDTLGASGVSTSRNLDRHWRNARTVASHNPVIYKARIVGDFSVNGTTPPYVWDIGTAASVAQQGGSTA
ncbi:acyl-CoA dehydrogenase family protein [Kineococcus rubinsiae]|uniref:acyl-CoA dehydrogenase family protein n=1 Tax=Kineococcus rubinsiae TaxID=2609562 RepID=UPI0027E4C5D7|nr:acyl-CoA dehydrogenase family protein [Kineococcus rubinsiae]